MSYSKFSQSAIEGLDAEKRYQTFMQERGFEIYRCRESMNMVDHIDFQGQWTIDVKKMKRISRKDSTPSDAWTWIEIKGNTGPGWLYGTQATFIAFELNKGWLWVRPTHLITFVEDIVDHTKWVNEPYEAKYRLYSRQGKEDIITLVETKELKKIGTVWK